MNNKHNPWVLFFFLCLFISLGFAQEVKSSIDSTTIKIGEQITYRIQVETDTVNAVIFPENQSFLPLEVIEFYKPDTAFKGPKYAIERKYALTQFDSGSYTIPRQKILIGGKIIFTDSLKVEVRNVEVDTTKQKLYDIKPIIEVDKSLGNWWKYLLLILLILGLVAFLIYWFVWREKPLTKEEKVALLPPYERAKLALQELDEARFLEKDQIKNYYSELTLIIRKYLDEKVYDHSLESTTDELINRLRLLKDGNQLDLDRETIKNIESILKRADLVKFAKSKPDKELAKIDRNTIDLEIDHVKESLPEPTEEERLADLKYQEELAKKKKRKRLIITIAIGALLIIGTTIGLIAHYGFSYVKDTVFGHPTKELLESKEWVMSQYGAPPVRITTPKVLERQPSTVPDELKDKVKDATFKYVSGLGGISIAVSTTAFVLTPEEEEAFSSSDKISEDLLNASEGYLNVFENDGASNITVKREQFITPNGQEGLKTYGSFNQSLSDGEDRILVEYVLLHFRAKNVRQQIVLIWEKEDTYANDIMDRVIESIELITLTEDDQ